MNITQKIEDAKSCIANIAAEYVKARTFGVSTPDMFVDLLLMNQYIQTLERYDCSCKSCDPCLSEDEVCFILMQIALSCEGFACGC